jgi:hypothetical protein
MMNAVQRFNSQLESFVEVGIVLLLARWQQLRLNAMCCEFVPLLFFWFGLSWCMSACWAPRSLGRNAT